MYFFYTNDEEFISMFYDSALQHLWNHHFPLKTNK